MDGSRFDALVRFALVSRRSLLTSLLGAIAGGLATPAVVPEVEAKRRGGKKHKHKAKKREDEDEEDADAPPAPVPAPDPACHPLGERCGLDLSQFVSFTCCDQDARCAGSVGTQLCCRDNAKVCTGANEGCCHPGDDCKGGICCRARRQDCDGDTVCCEGRVCRGGVCCGPPEFDCDSDPDCCGDGKCDNGACCARLGQACSRKQECCDHATCQSGTCCLAKFEPCTDDGECCSGVCDDDSHTCGAPICPEGTGQCDPGQDECCDPRAGRTCFLNACDETGDVLNVCCAVGTTGNDFVCDPVTNFFVSCP
jgi:hypothetical protein